MILSFSDFLADNAVIIILIILGCILGVIGYIKRNYLAKYNNDDELEQTPEEILQDELDNLLVTEKYVPNQPKKKDILDEDDDDFDYDHQEPVEKVNDDDFVMNENEGYSLPTFEDRQDN